MSQQLNFPSFLFQENYLRRRLLMNRLDYYKECGIPMDDNEYEQNQTFTKQLLMKLFAVSLLLGAKPLRLTKFIFKSEVVNVQHYKE